MLKQYDQGQYHKPGTIIYGSRPWLPSSGGSAVLHFYIFLYFNVCVKSPAGQNMYEMPEVKETCSHSYWIK